MRTLVILLLAVSFSNAAEPLKLVAAFGTAKVAGSGRFLVSPDGKTVIIGDRWFDFESGKRIEPPIKLPESASWHSILNDGTVVMAHEDKLHFYPPNQTKAKFELEAKAYRVYLSQNGKVAARVIRFNDRIHVIETAIPSKGTWTTAIKSSEGTGNFDHWELAENGSRIVAIENKRHLLTVYTVASGKTQTFDLSDKKYQGLNSPNISADGTLIVLHGEKSWKVFNAINLELLYEVPFPEGIRDVYLSRFTPDGNSLIGFDFNSHWVTVSLNELKPTVRVHQFAKQEYDVEDYRLIARPIDNHTLLFTFDGSIVRLHDTVTGKRLDTHSDVTQRFDGQLIIDNRRVLAWNLDNHYFILDTVTGKELRRDRVPISEALFDTPQWQANLVKKTLAISVSLGTVQICLEDGKPVGPSDPMSLSNKWVRYHPDGRVLLHVAQDEETDHPKTKIHDADTGQLLGTVNVSDTDSRYFPIHYHPNGRIAITGNGGEVALYELVTGAKRWSKQIPGPYGRILLNCSGDRITYVTDFDVKQLDVRTGRVTQSFNREKRPFV